MQHNRQSSEFPQSHGTLLLTNDGAVSRGLLQFRMHLLSNVLSRSAMKSSSSLVSPSLATTERGKWYSAHVSIYIWYFHHIPSASVVHDSGISLVLFSCCNLRFGDIRVGEVGESLGESTVGELSLSSLKLKLFLLRDSAPDTRQNQSKLDWLVFYTDSCTQM